MHAWFLSGGIVLGDCGPTGGGSIAVGSGSLEVPTLRLTVSPFWFHLPDPLNVIALLQAPSTTTRSYHPPPCFLHCNELFSNCKPKPIFFSLRLVLVNIRSQNKQSDQYSIIISLTDLLGTSRFPSTRSRVQIMHQRGERSKSFRQCSPLLRNFVFEGASLLAFPLIHEYIQLSVFSHCSTPRGFPCSVNHLSPMRLPLKPTMKYSVV